MLALFDATVAVKERIIAVASITRHTGITVISRASLTRLVT